MKKPLRALGFLTAVEIALYLLAATAAWAIADHDLATLNSSFFENVQTALHAKIVGGVLGIIVVINVVMFLKIVQQGEKPVAVFGLLATAGIVSLYFLPTMFSAYGLGGLIALFATVKILALLWKGVSWPFRKVFGRKKTVQEPGATPAKTASAKMK